LASPFKSKSRLEAENAALRQQLIVLQRRGCGRVHFTNSDRLFFVQLYRRAFMVSCSSSALRSLSNLLHVLVIVRLARRELVWINVTSYPTAEWIARQVTEAFPWEEAPRYLIRDQDGIYGAAVTRRLRAMGIRDKPIAPGSPWQNGFAERLIGSIRRECVDHVVVLSKAHLRRILQEYACYYNELRTHRSLNKDAPRSRSVQQTGHIQSHSLLGGLHHQYVRI
jgi:transposase InsO family protein